MLSRFLGVRIFDLEACGACNLTCPFCPREQLPPTGNMSEATFNRFLEQVTLGASDTLSFVGIGEPTMNRRLPGFIESAKARYPNVRTWITSNGTFLNKGILPPLLMAGLDTLDVSFNGLEKGAYEKMMRGARFESVLANLEYAANEIERKGVATRLQINFILTRENVNEEERIKAFWRDRGIQHFRIQRMHDRNGDTQVEGMTPLDAPGLRCGSCSLFEVITFITWEGHVMYCCHDLRRRHRLGNINTESWEEIQARKANVVRGQAWPAMCGRCTDPLRHDMRDKVDEMIQKEIRENVFSGIRSSLNKMTKLITYK